MLYRSFRYAKVFRHLRLRQKSWHSSCSCGGLVLTRRDLSDCLRDGNELLLKLFVQTDRFFKI